MLLFINKKGIELLCQSPMPDFQINGFLYFTVLSDLMHSYFTLTVLPFITYIPFASLSVQMSFPTSFPSVV